MKKENQKQIKNNLRILIVNKETNDVVLDENVNSFFLGTIKERPNAENNESAEIFNVGVAVQTNNSAAIIVNALRGIIENFSEAREKAIDKLQDLADVRCIKRPTDENESEDEQ